MDQHPEGVRKRLSAFFEPIRGGLAPEARASLDAELNALCHMEPLLPSSLKAEEVGCMQCIGRVVGMEESCLG